MPYSYIPTFWNSIDRRGKVPYFQRQLTSYIAHVMFLIGRMLELSKVMLLVKSWQLPVRNVTQVLTGVKGMTNTSVYKCLGQNIGTAKSCKSIPGRWIAMTSQARMKFQNSKPLRQWPGQGRSMGCKWTYTSTKNGRAHGLGINSLSHAKPSGIWCCGLNLSNWGCCGRLKIRSWGKDLEGKDGERPTNSQAVCNIISHDVGWRGNSY
jgi:hypothetical protein